MSQWGYTLIRRALTGAAAGPTTSQCWRGLQEFILGTTWHWYSLLPAAGPLPGFLTFWSLTWLIYKNKGFCKSCKLGSCLTMTKPSIKGTGVILGELNSSQRNVLRLASTLDTSEKTASVFKLRRETREEAPQPRMGWQNSGRHYHLLSEKTMDFKISMSKITMRSALNCSSKSLCMCVVMTG